MTSDLLDGLLRAPAPRPKQPTSRERAAMNKHRVLCAVAEHGHLRCTDLAAACWQGARFGEQMAQRTVRALVESGELKPRANALGGTSFVLTRPGAAALEVRGIAAHHGLDLAVNGPTFRHTALTSRWCIHKQAQGFQAFTEYAIANGRAPLSREALFKRLGRHVDAALIKGDKLYACETESAPKATAELMRIAAMAEHVGRKLHPDMPYMLAGVFIVFDAEQNHAQRIAKAARGRWARCSAADQATLAGRITLARVSLGLPLVWRGCSEERLTLQPKVRPV
jgi:hypothetical protein